jgi:hypothetical protein
MEGGFCGKQILAKLVAGMYVWLLENAATRLFFNSLAFSVKT